MVALGDADALVTGLTRNFIGRARQCRRAIDQRPGHTAPSASPWRWSGRTVFIADTSIHDCPRPRNWPTLRRRRPVSPGASATSRAWRCCPIPPSLSRGERGAYVRDAVGVLDRRNVDFEYDGEMGADVALSRESHWRSIPSAGSRDLPMSWSCPPRIRFDLHQDAAAAGRVTVVGPCSRASTSPCRLPPCRPLPRTS